MGLKPLAEFFSAVTEVSPEFIGAVERSSRPNVIQLAKCLARSPARLRIGTFSFEDRKRVVRLTVFRWRLAARGNSSDITAYDSLSREVSLLNGALREAGLPYRVWLSCRPGSRGKWQGEREVPVTIGAVDTSLPIRRESAG